MAEMSPLLRRMTEDMTVRNLSPATQRSYLHAVTKFSRYFERSPDRLGSEDVRAFQIHLVSTGISWPALNQTVCALRFFYGITLGHGEIPERIAYAREPSKLPVVLSADEVVRFLEAVASLKTRAALTTAHAAGLRASETVALKVHDIDSGRMVILIECGKGGKDRTVMLSTQLPSILRTYWRLARPGHWLFPGCDDGNTICGTAPAGLEIYDNAWHAGDCRERPDPGNSRGGALAPPGSRTLALRGIPHRGRRHDGRARVASHGLCQAVGPAAPSYPERVRTRRF